MTSRRRFLVTAGVTIIALPLTVKAQPPGRLYRLGHLSPAPFASLDVILTTLRELGYVQGQNLVVERRYADGNLERLPSLARELVQARVDVIVASGLDAIKAAKDATTTVPIVMGFTIDSVRHGFVASLAHPGGNITGVSYSVGPEITAKRVELIKEAVPRATRIAVLSTPEASSQNQVHQARNAASRVAIDVIIVDVRDADYDRAFTAIVAKRASALLVVGSPVLNRDRKKIIALAAKHHLPAIYEWREHVEEGGLMAYGADLAALYRRVATYVDRIFRGAKPADLPVEQPATFTLAINLKTAKALGLTIPPSLLLQATEMIQ